MLRVREKSFQFPVTCLRSPDDHSRHKKIFGAVLEWEPETESKSRRLVSIEKTGN